MIWLIGDKGMLAGEIASLLTANKIDFFGSDMEIDIGNIDMLKTFAASHDRNACLTGATACKGKVTEKISWVINCGAYTDAQKAETSQDEEIICNRTNSTGALNVARLTRQIGAKLIHISTSAVFDGKNPEPYDEEAVKNPLSKYGASKAQGDFLVEKEITRYYIIRLPLLYANKNSSFLTKMIKAMNSKSEIKVPQDVICAPTYAQDVAKLILKIIETSDKAHSLFGKKSAIPYGVYNYSASGSVSLSDFAQKVYKLGRQHGIIKNECSVLSSPQLLLENNVKFPAGGLLNTEKISSAVKIKIPHWEESLEKFIKHYSQSSLK